MITSINEWRTINELSKWEYQLDWTHHKQIYRNITEGKFLEYLYGRNFGNGMGPKNIFANLPKTTNYVLYGDFKDDLTNKNCSCWTMDRNYTGAAFNESYLRLAFDVPKLMELKDRIFYGDGNVSEMELRIEGNILNWPKYLGEIQTTEEIFENGYNDEEFDVFYPPTKEWLPKELHRFVNFYYNSFFMNGPSFISKSVAKHVKSYQSIGFK